MSYISNLNIQFLKTVLPLLAYGWAVTWSIMQSLGKSNLAYPLAICLLIFAFIRMRNR